MWHAGQTKKSRAIESCPTAQFGIVWLMLQYVGISSCQGINERCASAELTVQGSSFAARCTRLGCMVQLGSHDHLCLCTWVLATASCLQGSPAAWPSTTSTPRAPPLVSASLDRLPSKAPALSHTLPLAVAAASQHSLRLSSAVFRVEGMTPD